MVKTVLGAKIVEIQNNWGRSEIGDIKQKGKLQKKLRDCLTIQE